METGARNRFRNPASGNRGEICRIRPFLAVRLPPGQHQKAITTMMSMMISLRKELASISQAAEAHFARESIDDIFANKLNLRFIHTHDLPQVLRIILRQTNINAKEADDAVPIVEFINQLLLQQRIEFMQINQKESTGGNTIGNLLFTSFFAASNKNQQPSEQEHLSRTRRPIKKTYE